MPITVDDSQWFDGYPDHPERRMGFNESTEEDEVDDASPVAFPKITRGNPFGHATTLVGTIRHGMSSTKENDRNGRIYASQASFCVRQAVLKSTNNEDLEIVTPTNAAYYALGITIEDLVINALTRQGALLYPQYKLPDIGLNLGGYIDAIVMIGGKIRVLEVKSCGVMVTEPKPEHAAQAMVYSAVTGLPASLLYFSRHVAGFDGQLQIKEFPLIVTNDDARRTLFRVAYVHHAIEMGIIPDMPDYFTVEQDCGYCPFKENCWHNYPLPRPVVSPKQHLKITNAAKAIVDDLMDPSLVEKRRNGILRHIQQHGSDAAKKLLRGDWSSYL